MSSDFERDHYIGCRCRCLRSSPAPCVWYCRLKQGWSSWKTSVLESGIIEHRAAHYAWMWDFTSKVAMAHNWSTCCWSSTWPASTKGTLFQHLVSTRRYRWQICRLYWRWEVTIWKQGATVDCHAWWKDCNVLKVEKQSMIRLLKKKYGVKLETNLRRSWSKICTVYYWKQNHTARLTLDVMRREYSYVSRELGACLIQWWSTRTHATT